jgi:hypothetical protein
MLYHRALGRDLATLAVAVVDKAVDALGHAGDARGHRSGSD